MRSFNLILDNLGGGGAKTYKLPTQTPLLPSEKLIGIAVRAGAGTAQDGSTIVNADNQKLCFVSFKDKGNRTIVDRLPMKEIQNWSEKDVKYYPIDFQINWNDSSITTTSGFTPAAGEVLELICYY